MPESSPRRPRRGAPAFVAADIVLVLLSAAASKSGKGRKADDAVFGALNRGLRGLRPVFWVITQGGWFGSVILWCAICLAKGRRRLALDLLGAALLSWVLSQGGKELVALERPWERLDGTHRIGGVPWGSSYPSGHPAVSFAVAGVLEADQEVPRGLKRFAHAWAAGVALSRMVVGAHYPLDVVGGAALGDLAALIWVAAAPEGTTAENPSGETTMAGR